MPRTEVLLMSQYTHCGCDFSKNRISKKKQIYVSITENLRKSENGENEKQLSDDLFHLLRTLFVKEKNSEKK